jgi:hypothetical protein
MVSFLRRKYLMNGKLWPSKVNFKNCAMVTEGRCTVSNPRKLIVESSLKKTGGFTIRLFSIG